MHLTLIRALRRRVRDESGVTVLLALFVLTLTTLILGAVYQAVRTDTAGTRLNLDQGRAYAAAQAGIAQYTYQLNQNPNYWQSCPVTGGLTYPQSGKVAVPNSTDGGSTEYYSYLPLPATSAPANKCDPANPNGSMLEGVTPGKPILAAGTFRIQFTGYSNNVKRSIVAQFKQPSFLKYVYYTEYETLDPAALYDPTKNPSEPTDCARHYPNRGNDCVGINFITADTINGPLHSEDWLAVCGSPTFGRVGFNDPIEALGFNFTCGGSNPVINNTTHALNTKSQSLTPPATNSQLLSTATSGGYVYTGRTTIVLNGTTMKVTTSTAQSNTGTTVAWPTNGVIYVKTANTGCPVTYTPFTANATYTGDSNCGNVYVSGTYTKSLTIASDNDVIINGNITTTTTGALGTAPSGSQELGLIANDFARVYNQVTNPSGSYAGNCETAAAAAAAPAPSRRRTPGQLHLRGDPRGQPLVHRRQLRLRIGPRDPHRLWRDRAALPRRGRHRRQRERLQRVRQGLQLRRPPLLQRAAVLPQPDLDGLVRRAPDRVRHRLLGRPRAGAR